MKIIVRCLRQIFRPTDEIKFIVKGRGNCLICKYDPINNKKCSGFIPINITVDDIKNNNS